RRIKLDEVIRQREVDAEGICNLALRIALDRKAQRAQGIGAALLLFQIILFQEFGPELLWRREKVRPALWREVHEIPIRPDRVDVIARQFGSPEMKNLSALLPEDMHHGPLHVVGVSLAFVIG